MKPLNIPKGSVRSILAFVVVIGGLVFLYKFAPAQEALPFVKEIVILVLGWYFISRASDRTEEK